MASLSWTLILALMFATACQILSPCPRGGGGSNDVPQVPRVMEKEAFWISKVEASC